MDEKTGVRLRWLETELPHTTGKVLIEQFGGVESSGSIVLGKIVFRLWAFAECESEVDLTRFPPMSGSKQKWAER